MAAFLARSHPVQRTVRYRRVLLPLLGEGPRAVHVACRLAAEDAAIVAVVPLEVPLELPFEVPLLEEGARARSLLGEARAVAAAYGIALRARIVRTRLAGPALVEEAERSGSDVVVVCGRLEPRGRHTSFGPTVDHVLAHAPCRVVLVALR